MHAALRRFLSFSVFLAVLAVVSGTGVAAPPAPSWFPNSPILAGPQVILLWVPVPGAVKYKIYLNGKLAGEAATSQHMLPIPEEAGEHKYEVSAVDASGAEGAKSPPGTIRLMVLMPPGEIFSRVADKNVFLKWKGTAGSIVYNIYRSEKRDGEYKLVSSVQSDSYTDTQTEVGKTYYYAVSGKDASGKESKRSEPIEVVVAKAAVAVAKLAIPLKIVPSSEVRRVSFPSDFTSVRSFVIGPDGAGYIAEGDTGAGYRIDLESGAVLTKYGAKGVGNSEFQLPNAILAAKSGKVYVADASGKVNVYEADGSYLSSIKLEIPDPIREKEIYDNAPSKLKGAKPAAGGIAVDEQGDTLYVISGTYNTIYKFSLAGKPKGFIGNGSPVPAVNLSLPSVLMLSADRKELFVVEPVTHLIKVFDIASGKVRAMIGQRKDEFVGGFLGISGLTFGPKGQVVVADSAFHAIQVFDPTSFDYLFHIGDENPVPDPVDKRRPKFDFPYQSYPQFDKGGNFIIYSGQGKFLSVRKISWDKVVQVKAEGKN